MAVILLVEDDPDQLELRAMTLEAAGYEVRRAATAAEALALAEGAQAAIVDLRIPALGDGVALVRTLEECWPRMKRIAVTGWSRDLAALNLNLDEVFEKPVPTKRLIHFLSKLFLLLAAAIAPAATFDLARAGDAVLDLELEAPGKDWTKSGSESALADVIIDGKVNQQIMVYAGATPHHYKVFATALPSGRHELVVNGATLRSFRAAIPETFSTHAPILFERRSAIGKFSDIPLMTYCETLPDNALQYTVIFSNEDGGTSTRSLMARWGRTTDIEMVYRVWLNADGSRKKALIQSREHKEIEFTGPFEGNHPLLIPVTENNMVAGEGPSKVRYQPAPVFVDLSSASRETVMDANPQTWKIMTAELVRENKLRAYGEERGETISDPRNYLYIESNVRPGKAAIAFAVKHANGQYFYSHKGRTKDAINRDGWVRSTIELPPGTKAADLRSIQPLCVYLANTPSDFPCGPATIEYLFFLGPDMLPAKTFTLPLGNN
ncbi:MAG: response regulator [Acidobacteria bacterium]|nr:response regulator [Acidobacteriota bacterium]